MSWRKSENMRERERQTDKGVTQHPAQSGCCAQPDRSWENRLLSCSTPPPGQPSHPALNQELGLPPWPPALPDSQPPVQPQTPYPRPSRRLGALGQPCPIATLAQQLPA